MIWLGVRTLQATLFGLPPRLLLTAEPLDDYMRRGLLAFDPRSSLDPSARQLLAGVANMQRHLGKKVGIRISGVAYEQVVGHRARTEQRCHALAPGTPKIHASSYLRLPLWISSNQSPRQRTIRSHTGW